MCQRLTGPSSRILASADQRLAGVTTRMRLYDVFYWTQAAILPLEVPLATSCPHALHEMAGLTRAEARYYANYKHVQHRACFRPPVSISCSTIRAHCKYSTLAVLGALLYPWLRGSIIHLMTAMCLATNHIFLIGFDPVAPVPPLEAATKMILAHPAPTNTPIQRGARNVMESQLPLGQPAGCRTLLRIYSWQS